MTKKASTPEPAAPADNTAQKPLRGVPFAPGNNANPAGRPKGSRNKLGEAFIAALHEDFAEHGVEAIKAVRQTEPASYVRVIASLLPKELKIETVSDLTDEQLDARIRHLAALIEVGTGGAVDGAPAPEQPHPPEPVRAIH